MDASDATWKQNSVSNDWNTAENWRPQTIPNSTGAIATFGGSNTTTVLCQKSSDGVYAHTYVGDVVFAPGASAYTIRITPASDVLYPSLIEFHQHGIVNNSGIVQNLVAANSGTTKASGAIYFAGAASAGDNVVITNEGGASASGDGYYGGLTEISAYNGDTASAGNATFINNGGTVDGSSGGFTFLLQASSAEAATFISNPGAVSGANAGYTWVALYSPGNIHNSAFIANAATVSGAEGGWAEIDGGTCEGASFTANGATIAGAQGGQIYVYGADGYATFNGKGGSGSDAQGGLIDLFNLPNSAQTIVIAEAGRNGGLGGTIMAEEDAVLDQGQFRLRGNGALDLTNGTTQSVSIGSLAGNGMVSLAGHTLSIGNNNLSTTFSGLIQEDGSITKVGTGTLTVTGANNYTGATTVTAGTLRINNQTGSGTGTGNVKLNAGILGGQGIIGGLVTIGTGNGAGAVLAPSAGSNRLAVLTIQRALTFKADGTYTYRLNTRNPSADQVIAKGLTIESRAQFVFQSLGSRRLQIGEVFIAISNTSPNPIVGTFANLPDNSTFISDHNNFQVSYSGGDGNDLTLTVVP
ncbi:MAG TPA: autotransporter-associated beta strand repeat-containing protein [Candidatus Udaeobacter sp.]|nr:autotransporter-associated beta strand repeat-containing protein [Candidatus Udaeobacter sp.]